MYLLTKYYKKKVLENFKNLQKYKLWEYFPKFYKNWTKYAFYRGKDE